MFRGSSNLLFTITLQAPGMVFPFPPRDTVRTAEDADPAALPVPAPCHPAFARTH